MPSGNLVSRPSSVVKCSELGVDAEHEAGGKYGTKLKRVVETIKGAAKEDRILVFVQFPDLMQVRDVSESGRYHNFRISSMSVCRYVCLCVCGTLISKI